jgi:septal ring factor EnvC (AmiA/AmiB activator)
MSMVFCTAEGQTTVEELREQIRRDQQQLEATNALLGRNRDNIRLSERGLKLVRNNIAIRRNMVRNLEREAALILSEITANTRQVRELDTQLEALKTEYGAMIRSAWENHKLNNAVAFLFASRDFNDATRRIAYMKRYNAMREKRGAEIDSLDYILQYELEKLEVRKTELDRSKAQRTGELTELDRDEQQQSSALAGLRTDGRKLETQAREQRNKIAAAQRNIDRIIAEENRAITAGRSQAQIEADVILSGKFEDNKGRLQWPVGGPGSVLDRFGRHSVASQKDITNDFKGINIAAPRGAQVRAVFEGEVTGVYNLDHFNNCVTERSGSYIVLYANLAATSVRMGDRVAINRQIGSLFDTDDESQHLLIFQIWRETTPVDPEQWLRK